MKVVRSNSDNLDFQSLVNLLDQDLAKRDGEDHSFYDQFNKLDDIKHALVLYMDTVPVACGAFKEFDKGTFEVKRMYVVPEYRNKGLASKVLSELESWGTELGYVRSVLETGKKQPEAIQLYLKNNYSIIQNYGQYKGIDNSICFEKKH